MPATDSFDYAIIRLVPRVERGEFINVGVVLFCRTRRFLGLRTNLNKSRLQALAPDCDPAEIQTHLDLLACIAAGTPDSGPIGQLSQAERFHWLVSPRSTVIQPSPVHCGLCHNPQAALDRLFEQLVE